MNDQLKPDQFTLPQEYAAVGISYEAWKLYFRPDSRVSLLEIRIHPLPPDLVQLLSDHLRDKANEFLKLHDLVTGVVTEAPGAPPQVLGPESGPGG